MSDRFELLKTNRAKCVERDKKKLASLKIQAELLKDEGDAEELEELQVKVNELLFTLTMHESLYKDMREATSEDTNERVDMYKNATREVDEAIPDGIPIVFHGNNNIGLVETIMKTGGLFTPDERGVGYRSLATQIDVTGKKYIGTSLEFAEPGIESYMPYGAIFAFMPSIDEYDKVLKTGTGSEVPGGVKGVNFREEPDRLVGVITTNENLDRLRTLANTTGIDPSKVVTKEGFLELCKEKYNSKTR